ncbi:class D sortase [Virgibacillus profundi]|uniref:Class D sortase n=1 Tax=Virgibacillus profundi TaxID=2024555 RepID=A0A2A2I7W5_9BACI|nr:class D sortase [Virgibacillus profundi]PAV27672.1 class D sortase [Virgibacillus profundi]PXY51827.1 class D sortase [Virgibacillus profundi]
MKIVGAIFITIGLVLIGFFGYEYISQSKDQDQSLAEAQERLDKSHKAPSQQTQTEDTETIQSFTADHMEAFGTLEIPKLEETIAIVEGADEDALSKGVGHMTETAYPGKEEQIVLSGHRDTVFRNFGDLEIGDIFIVHMPYGDYEYEIRQTQIVPEDDTSVVGEMGEEALVVSTCYPFDFIGSAPDRFVAFAYPVEK